jgi:hypothetical protein
VWRYIPTNIVMPIKQLFVTCPHANIKNTLKMQGYHSDKMREKE